MATISNTPVPSTPPATTTAAPAAAAPAAAPAPNLSAEAQGVLTELSKDPAKMKAFQELIAAAVVASSSLMQQYGGAAGGGTPSPEQLAAQKAQEAQMNAQLDYLKAGAAQSMQLANSARDMAIQAVGMNSQIGSGIPNYAIPDFGPNLSQGLPGGFGMPQGFGGAPQGFGGGFPTQQPNFGGFPQQPSFGGFPQQGFPQQGFGGFPQQGFPQQGFGGFPIDQQGFGGFPQSFQPQQSFGFPAQAAPQTGFPQGFQGFPQPFPPQFGGGFGF